MSSLQTESSEADNAAAGRDDPFYSYKTSLMSSPWELALKPGGIEWRVGRSSGLIRYDRIRRVRVSYRPATMQSHRFVTEIWSDDGPKIQIVSCSWRGIMELARQDAPYASFVRELHRRLAAAGSRASFIAGTPRIVYGLGLAVFAAAIVTFTVLLLNTLWHGEWLPALVIVALLSLFAWQLGNFFHRNRPEAYRPDALPGRTLPRG